MVKRAMGLNVQNYLIKPYNRRADLRRGGEGDAQSVAQSAF